MAEMHALICDKCRCVQDLKLEATNHGVDFARTEDWLDVRLDGLTWVFCSWRCLGRYARSRVD